MTGTASATSKLLALGSQRLPVFTRAFLIWFTVAGLGAVAILESYRVIFGSNWHVLLPGRVYRSAQANPEQLEEVLKRYHIRTVVNLRGCCNPWPWYLEECRVTQRCNVSQEDICLSAGRLPSVHEVRRLVEVLDQAEYPLLLHCRRGADRTGLVSAIVMLLQPDVSLSRARRQLGFRYGHLALGRPANLDIFLELYSDWLKEQGKNHAPDRFRHWLWEEYPRSWRAYAVEKVGQVGPLRCGEPLAVRVRFRNTGKQPWPFRPGLTSGIHAAFVLWNPQDRQVSEGRAGLFEKDVAPGETIEVTVVMPPVAQPGKYRLFVDLIDERHSWFFQVGSEPLEEELDIRD